MLLRCADFALSSCLIFASVAGLLFRSLISSIVLAPDHARKRSDYGVQPSRTSIHGRFDSGYFDSAQAIARYEALLNETCFNAGPPHRRKSE